MMLDTSRKRARRYAFALLAGTGLPLALAAAPPEGRGAAPLGSPAFRPSPLHPVGWRGDGLAWKKVAGAVIDFNEVSAASPEKEGKVAYASSYAHAPEGFRAGIRTQGDHGGCKVVAPTDLKQWTFRAHLFACGSGARYDSQGIVWTRSLPGQGYSMPILVGDRLFVTSEPSDLAGDTRARIIHDVPSEKLDSSEIYSGENAQDVTNATPIFDGDRVCLRGEANLYCIGTS